MYYLNMIKSILGVDLHTARNVYSIMCVNRVSWDKFSTIKYNTRLAYKQLMKGPKDEIQ